MPAEQLMDWLRGWTRKARTVPGVVLPAATHREAVTLAQYCARHAPVDSGRLRRSFSANGPDVTSSAPYARLQDTGGKVVPLRYGWLTVPVRRGYQPGPNFVTVADKAGGQIIVRRGTREVWAVRRRSVTIRGSRYLQRALAAFERGAAERIAAAVAAEVKHG